MGTKLYLMVLMLVCTSYAITLQEIQNMKKDLDHELSMMQVTPKEKKEAGEISKDDSQDFLLDQFMKDIIKSDISKSLTNLKEDNDAEKTATDMLNVIMKEEQEKEAHVFDKILKDALVPDKSVTKESSASDGSQNAYKKLMDLKLTNAAKDQYPLVLSKKEALDAYSNLEMQDSAKRQSIHGRNCFDQRNDCNKLKAAKFCDIAAYNKYMTTNCAYSCSACFRCEDKWGRKKCDSLSKYCRVKKSAIGVRMKENCYETCGYCKLKSPPACQSKKFRCCWDNSTAKTDPIGTNCPVCQNMYKSLCKSFKPLCHSDIDSSPGKFVKHNCPEACGFCPLSRGGSCQDQVGYQTLCRKWRNQGLCEFKDIAGQFCKGTCNPKCAAKNKGFIAVS